MCMYLEKGWEKKTERMKSRKKPIKVYKVLERLSGRNESRPSLKDKLVSFYRAKVWKLDKINVSDRRAKTYKNGEKLSPTEITPVEKRYQRINKGLHFFVKKESAVRFLSERIPCIYYEIWEVEVFPEDVIAVGENFCADYTELVAHKAKLIRRVG